VSIVEPRSGGTGSKDDGDGAPGGAAGGHQGGEQISLDISEFLRANLPGLMRYGIALAGNPHDGADLVQTACEKAVLNWRRVSAADQPVALVKAIMANARISSWRKRRRESLLAELPEVSVTDGYPIDDAGVWGAVAALPRKQRAVIVLRYVEGHSEQEIADILKISVGTVKSHSSRAINSLQKTSIQDLSGFSGRAAS
jgi:RNA polymerase sigma-70 factor (sigma-E family)